MRTDFTCLLSASFVLFAATACSSGDGGDGRGFRGGEQGFVPECAVPSYASCPDAGAPIYEKDVVPVLNARCNECHGNGGQESGERNFTTLPGVKKYGSSMYSQIHSCSMPPPPLAPLTPKEQATVLEWFACGCPDSASVGSSSCSAKQ